MAAPREGPSLIAIGCLDDEFAKFHFDFSVSTSNYEYASSALTSCVLLLIARKVINGMSDLRTGTFYCNPLREHHKDLSVVTIFQW